ncbi:YecR family lipoprotein [Parvibaculum sp.]|uniref:YecR family lipoprotein n=1 Tax=Parvibaculum sp. TaxID=2024848 RepID=UPI003BAA53DE
MILPRPLVVSALLSATLFGCSSVKTPIPTGGSKSEGIIRMSYEDGMFESASADWSAADKIAAERCVDWGYGGAQRFGLQTSKCQISDSGICLSAIRTTEYQCTD